MAYSEAMITLESSCYQRKKTTNKLLINTQTKVMITRRNPKEIVNALEAYHNGVYSPKTHMIQELSLLHSVKMPTSGGGEFPLNNANTKRLVGVSDFQGEQIPSDATGLLRAIVVRYGTADWSGDPATSQNVSPAIVNYLETRANFPAWLLQSEVVLKSSSNELLRIRIAELVPSASPDKVPYDWAKEFEKLIKVEGNQTLQVYLNTPEGASDPNPTKDEYIQVVIYGVKIAPRTKA